MRTFMRLLLLIPLVVSVAACELTKTENPLSPSVAGPIPGVEISAPKLLEPVPNQQIAGDKQPITLLIENAYSTGQRPLLYRIDIATDGAFGNVVFSREGIEPGPNGRTSFTLPNALGSGRQYFWRAQAQDGANTGPYASMSAFALFTPVAFDKPNPISPVGGTKVTTTTPEFRFSNAPRTGVPGLVTYVIEVATNSSFSGLIAAWQFTEQAGETRFTAASGLPGGTQIFWHVRAFEATALGPWSDTATFVTPTPIAPPPTSGGGGGGACTNTTQLGVVTCRRNQFTGHMDAGQVLVFLKGIAGDLNRLGTWGSGYGLLRKTNGSSCGGYSCDIICQGTTESTQKQYDVLIDSDGTQGPIWAGPKVSPDIRFDKCDIP